MTDQVTSIGIGVDSRPVVDAGAALDRMAASGKKAEAAVSVLESANKSGTAAQKAANSSIEQYIVSLRQQAESIGKSAAQMREMEALAKGASESQLAQVKALGAQIDQMNAARSVASGLADSIGIVTRGTLALTVAAVAFEGAKMFFQAQEDARMLLSRIANITGSLTEARVVYRGLQDDSLRLRVGQEDVLQGYIRIAAAIKELGGTSKQARELNEIIIATARISGISGAEAAAAARQFAQALGSGVLQGDELRSILENNQELARQLAKGLNVSVGELRKLGEQGKLTADVVSNALLGRLPEIRKGLESVPLTAADAWQKLTTATSDWIVQGDQVETKAGIITRSINAMADAIRAAASSSGMSSGVAPGVLAGLAPFAAGAINGQTAQAQAATAARQQLADSVREVESLASRYGSAALGVAQATKTLREAVDKELTEFAPATDKFGKNIATAIEAMNKLQAQLERQRGIAQAAGQTLQVEQVDRDLARLSDSRERLAKIVIPSGIAEAQQSEWKKIEQIASRGMALQLQAYDTFVTDAAAANSRVIAGYDIQRIALEAAYQQGLNTTEEYVTKRRELLALEIDAAAGTLNTEETITRARLKLNQDAYRYISAAAGEEAAKRSEFAKQIAAAEAKLIDIETRRAQLGKKAIQENAALAKVEIDNANRLNVLKQQQGELDAKMIAAAAEVTRTYAAENEKLKEQIATFGMSEQQINARNIVLLEAKLATYDLAAAVGTMSEADRAAAEEIKEQIKALRERNGLFDAKEILEQAKKTRDETAQVWKGIGDDITNYIMSGFKNTRDLLKRMFETLILRPIISPIANGLAGGLQGLLGGLLGGSGGAGGGGGLLSGLLGNSGLLGGILGTGAGGIGGGILAGLIGPGSGLGSALGLASAVGPPTALAGAGVAGGAGSLGGSISSLIGAIPGWGWAAMAAAAVAALFIKDEKGFKFDNSLRNVAAAPANVQTSALGNFAPSGDVDGKILGAIQPFIAKVQSMDKYIADNLLSDDTLAKVREQIQQLQNPRWWNLEDKDAIEKASKFFLQQRYSVAFDEIDKGVADMIRTFSGTADELIQFITKASQSKQVIDALSKAQLASSSPVSTALLFWPSKAALKACFTSSGTLKFIVDIIHSRLLKTSTT